MANLGMIDFKFSMYIKVNVNTWQKRLKLCLKKGHNFLIGAVYMFYYKNMGMYVLTWTHVWRALSPGASFAYCGVQRNSCSVVINKVSNLIVRHGVQVRVPTGSWLKLSTY